MRKILIFTLLVFSACLTSCLGDDDGTNFFFELVPIEEVDIPEEFVRNETYEVSVFYYRPSDCHSFSGFELETLDNQLTLAAVNVVFNDRECIDIEPTELIEEKLNFIVGSEESYIFNFWKGTNDQDEGEFITIEVPVVEEASTTD
ncbi:hypothetical protein GCM10022393_08020 [Aquimarina addita]|uniref:Lipoprotein n=1 Tax=Aquimarina addita TaxID=870485 RepID=A0ABP7XBV1_9FLAO